MRVRALVKNENAFASFNSWFFIWRTEMGGRGATSGQGGQTTNTSTIDIPPAEKRGY